MFGYIERDMQRLIDNLATQYSCILLTGPRQVGKSTILSHTVSKATTVSLDDLDERKLAQNDPEMFFLMHKPPVIIDEVQYAPQLFSYIKIAIDKGAAPGSFFLTGSQEYKLMHLAQESLAGRVALLELSSLSQHELYGIGISLPFEVDVERLNVRKATFQPADVNEIYKRIFAGGMPGLASGKIQNRDVFFSSYVQTYIGRDVSEEIEGIDNTQFLQFIRACACRVGGQLNIHAIAGDVGVSDNTAKRWLGLLEKSGIVYFLYPYSNNLLKRIVKTPKMYFFDTGLVAYLTRYSSPETLMNGALSGSILENYVINQIRKSYFNNGKECLMYYYRDKDAKEIDICLEYDGKIHPIEIKKASNVDQSMIANFEVLKNSQVPVGTGAVVCMKQSLSAFDKNNLIVPIWLL